MRRALLVALTAALLIPTGAQAADEPGGTVVVPGNAMTRLNPARHTILVETNRTPQRITVFAWSPTRRAYYVRHIYRVATGRTEFPTPTGQFTIAVKVLHPTWIAPYSSWVPKADRGKRFGPDDPSNPLTGAWLGLSGGLGIGFHGTREESTLGARASHGCLRMTRLGVLSLYRLVTVDTPVTIE